ncbi:MAG: 4Fe-4S binding protein [Burkholderiaceae bacterium]|nr:4Fe-4S binding protein [Burkholderiaceae bacterium]
MNTSRKALAFIHTDRCTGCGWCVAVCPPHVLSLQVQGTAAWGPKRAQLHGAADCTGCALCAVRCPFDAIRMVRSSAIDATDAAVLPQRQDAH